MAPIAAGWINRPGDKGGPRAWLADVWGRRDCYAFLLQAETWILCIALFVAVVLAAPAQVIELYRIVYFDDNIMDVVNLYASVTAMSFFIWLGAAIVLAMAIEQIDAVRRIAGNAHMLPFGLAALPWIGCGLGHFAAMPRALDKQALSENVFVGSPWVKTSQDIRESIASDLTFHGIAFVILGLLCVILSVMARRWDYTKRLRGFGTARWSDNARDWPLPGWLRWVARNLIKWREFFLVFLLILAFDAVMVLWPVTVPRFFGTFGIMAWFVAALASNCALLTVLSYRCRLPFVPIFLMAALALSALDLNDNHALRTLSAGQAEAPSITTSFTQWYGKRPDLNIYDKDYPVYIVSAQGGGIYAAYQTAITLARLQDRCPEFRDHLFGISSVSGGSVGAASFVASLPPKPGGPDRTPLAKRCKSLFDAKDGAGPIEKRLNTALTEDHLSPLVAGMLFPDFTQRFFAPGWGRLDRARALEYSLEASLRQGDASPLAASLRQSWRATGSNPALVINTTDAGSGLRYLMAPFVIDPKDDWSDKSVDTYPLWSRDRDLSLSTAAVSSARFPWITPAGLVPAPDPENTAGQQGATDAQKAAGSDKAQDKAKRIVDGGYVDNSGIETALDMMKQLRSAKVPNGAPSPRFILIAITTSEIPKRGGFSLGETLEPVRALLSTRSSRAYLALGRAYGEAGELRRFPAVVDKMAPAVRISPVRPIALSNQFYELPLGWRLSSRTADIIARQSGRAWDCMPTDRMIQSQVRLSTADCVQALVAAEMSGTLPDAAERASIANYRAPWMDGKALPERLNHQAFLRCYDDRTKLNLTFAQARAADAMLRAWDRTPELTDPRLLAFMMAIVEDNTNNMLPVSQARETARKYSPDSRIGRLLGNIAEDDGERYRGRGFLYLTGRENYARVGKAIGIDLLAYPDLMLNPDVSARAAIWWMGTARRKPIAEAISGPSPNWPRAWRVMNGRERVEATARVRPFLQCIEEDRRTAPHI